MFGFDFGPGMGGRRRGKGEDSIHPYEVTLEDLYNGKSVKLNMEKEIVCGVCKGCVLPYFLNLLVFSTLASVCRSGARGNAKPKPCSTCSGQGWTPTQTRVRAFTEMTLEPRLIRALDAQWAHWCLAGDVHRLPRPWGTFKGEREVRNAPVFRQ